jgi:hypothetical protein
MECPEQTTKLEVGGVATGRLADSGVENTGLGIAYGHEK